MAEGQPNIWDNHWVRCNSKGYSASKIVRYLTRRPLDKEQAVRGAGWRELDGRYTFGNAEAFKEAANRRRREYVAQSRARGKDIEQDHSRGNVQYLHLVISPRSREDFAPEDFGALLEPWIYDGAGRRCEHFAAIHHDDPEGPKMHLVIARDKYKTRELKEGKDRGNELVEERENIIARERGRQPEREPEPEPEPEREPPGPERDRDEGREPDWL